VRELGTRVFDLLLETLDERLRSFKLVLGGRQGVPHRVDFVPQGPRVDHLLTHHKKEDNEAQRQDAERDSHTLCHVPLLPDGLWPAKAGCSLSRDDGSGGAFATSCGDKVCSLRREERRPWNANCVAHALGDPCAGCRSPLVLAQLRLTYFAEKPMCAAMFLGLPWGCRDARHDASARIQRTVMFQMCPLVLPLFMTWSM
jgi:hypothetical protein